MHQLVESAQEIALIISAKPSLDEQAVYAALSQWLNQLGKHVRQVAPQVPVWNEHLVPLGEVKTELGNQNLLVSFDYSEEQVDKISYHIGEETKKFYLTIKPKQGAEPLDPNTVTFARSGAEFDLVITVGVSDLNSLSSLYFGYEDLYKNTTLLSLAEYETSFGTTKLSATGASSLSEVVAKSLLAEALTTSLSAEVANKLLYGIESKTNGFRTLSTTAETFAVVAELMKRGGVRAWKPVTANSAKNSKTNQGQASSLSGKKTQETTVQVVPSAT